MEREREIYLAAKERGNGRSDEIYLLSNSEPGIVQVRNCPCKKRRAGRLVINPFREKSVI